MTKLTKDHPLFEKYIRLSCRLSPENLASDGEASAAEVRRRRKQIAIEWAALDIEFGRPMTESEVWDAEIAARNATK